MARSVAEWRGKTDDTPVPKRVKLRILKRQEDKCAGDGCPVRFSSRCKPQFDHVIALTNHGENREANLQALCPPCHRAKTGADVAEKSKTNDMKAKHLDLHKSKRPFPKRHDPWGKEWRSRSTFQRRAS